MKIGFNLLLWTPHVTAKHRALARSDIKKTGYDGVEMPMFEGDARTLCGDRRACWTRSGSNARS